MEINNEQDMFWAALTANQTAWSSLVEVLYQRGGFDLNLLEKDLSDMQGIYRDCGEENISSQMKVYLDLVNGLRCI